MSSSFVRHPHLLEIKLKHNYSAWSRKHDIIGKIGTIDAISYYNRIIKSCRTILSEQIRQSVKLFPRGLSGL